MGHEDIIKTRAVAESTHETVADLVRLVGVDNTVKIVDYFSGSNIYIPLMESLVKKERDKGIYADFLSGMSYAELSRKYRVANMTARKIVSDMMKKGRKPC